MFQVGTGVNKKQESRLHKVTFSVMSFSITNTENHKHQGTFLRFGCWCRPILQCWHETRTHECWEGNSSSWFLGCVLLCKFKFWYFQTLLQSLYSITAFLLSFVCSYCQAFYRSNTALDGQLNVFTHLVEPCAVYMEGGFQSISNSNSSGVEWVYHISACGENLSIKNLFRCLCSLYDYRAETQELVDNFSKQWENFCL